MTGADDGRVDFFISHASPDAEWAEWVGAQLVEAGYTVELDVWDWSAGTNFVLAMERALDRAQRMVAVLSPAYFERTWTRVEQHAAFVDHAQTGDGYLVPVVVEPCDEAVPRLFRLLIRVDLAGLDEAQARRRLLDGIAGARRPAPGEKVPFPGEKVLFPAGLPVARNLPARNLFFTGRHNLLADLGRRLHQDGGAGRVAVSALQGVGGVGKSQLALEYAWRHATDYRIVWWVDADDPTGVDGALADLAAVLGLPVRGGAATVGALVRAELARRADWLLVYDNIDDVDRIGELPAAGHVIVTCRGPAIGCLLCRSGCSPAPNP
jgi:hypothetical protein